MTDQNIVFKNSKTGKVDTINASDMDFVNFQRMLDTYGIRIFMKNGSLHRFSGFKDADQEKIASYFKNNYKQEMLEKELSLRGWNYGTAQFNGSLLSFNVENKTSFDIPLNVVSQCTPGKNEVTLEFHQDDEGPVSLMEMRFHIPTTETAETDPVDGFYQNVMDKASVISVSGDAIAIFREIHCLTPRLVGDKSTLCNPSTNKLLLSPPQRSLRHQDLPDLLPTPRQDVRLQDSDVHSITAVPAAAQGQPADVLRAVAGSADQAGTDAVPLPRRSLQHGG